MTLRLAGVSYRYAGSNVDVLRDITLEVTPGRVVGVTGPSESGKSTLCLVAAGLAPAVIGGTVQGSVALDGNDALSLPAHARARACGSLFQNPTTQLSGTARTVWEEIAFGPRNLGLTLPDVVERVDASATALGIEGLLARDPARLSGGQAQLVALATVLALRPDQIVLDEPTSQLDPLGTRLVGETLARLAAAGTVGILIVEQKPELLAAIADELVILDQGRIARAGPTAAVQSDPSILELGVEAPAHVRIARAAQERGLVLDEVVLA